MTYINVPQGCYVLITNKSSFEGASTTGLYTCRLLAITDDKYENFIVAHLDAGNHGEDLEDLFFQVAKAVAGEEAYLTAVPKLRLILDSRFEEEDSEVGRKIKKGFEDLVKNKGGEKVDKRVSYVSLEGNSFAIKKREGITDCEKILLSGSPMATSYAHLSEVSSSIIKYSNIADKISNPLKRKLICFYDGESFVEDAVDVVERVSKATEISFEKLKEESEYIRKIEREGGGFSR